MSKSIRKILSLLLSLFFIFSYLVIPSNAEIDIPFNIQAAPAITSITISWDEVTGVTAYEVEADCVIIENITATSYEDTGLIPETEHTYRVRAIGGEAVGEWSETVTVSTMAEVPEEIPDIPDEIPGIVNNVTAIPGSTSITISWDEVTGATSYEVEADGVIIENITATSYEDTGLIPETEHTYRIRAKNEEITGEWSETVTVSTMAEVPEEIPDIPDEIPGIVNNVTAIPGSTSVAISWDEVTGATSYEVEADGVIIENITATSYEDTGLIPETEHTYRVRAENEEIVGEWSEPVTVSTIADLGQGTQEDPFIITTRQQLEGIYNSPDSFYILGDNIDLENEEWITSQYEFTGGLDGNGYTICNLKITRDGVNNIGLFGKASGAIIKKLKLNNVDIRGADNVGGLVGFAKANTVIEDCSITGAGQITGTGSVGGIAGKADNTTISKCYSAVDVIGTNEYIGGVVGYNHYSLNIQQSCSNGNVSGKRYVGGILGGKNSTDNNVRIENCCSLGNVTVTAGFAGGVIGYSHYANIINCYAAGQISGDGSYIGGIAGYKLVNIISDCYFDGIVNNNLVASGIDYHFGKLTSGMKAQVTFKNWDFEDIWNIDEGNSYPYLRNIEEPENIVIGATNDVASGIGTMESPYLILSKQQLMNMRCDLTGHFLLGDNIDLENEEWITSQYEFTGSLDGNGYTISNLKITRDGASNIGLFGKASGAAIRNLNLNNLYIKGTDNVGGLVGFAKANTVIEGCSITGAGQITGTGSIGGIAGKADNTIISKCYSTANVTGTNEYIGGLVGYNHYSLNIQQSCSNGSVSGKRYVGGILGGKNSTDNSVRIENCCSLGTVTVTAGFVGGVIGYSWYAVIKNCYTAGQVSGD